MVSGRQVLILWAMLLAKLVLITALLVAINQPGIERVDFAPQTVPPFREAVVLPAAQARPSVKGRTCPVTQCRTDPLYPVSSGAMKCETVATICTMAPVSR